MIEYGKSRNGITFPVQLLDENIQRYKIIYEQSAPAQYFEYILNTTLDWHFPLASAEFIIIIPDNIILESISMPDYEMSKQEDKTTYRIFREKFRSDQNLSIRWRLK